MKNRPGPHLFAADTDVPADHLGRRACSQCHVMGRPGDARHTMPDVPEQAEARARIGEKED